VKVLEYKVGQLIDGHWFTSFCIAFAKHVEMGMKQFFTKLKIYCPRSSKVIISIALEAPNLLS